MKSKSFTLIELLVVIVIIGILAGVIMISTSSSITKANLAKAQAFSSTVQNELLLNLVSEWTFDNIANIGEDTWANNDGIISGDPQIVNNDCIFGKCLELDGDDYIDYSLNNNLRLTGSQTTSFWYKYNLLIDIAENRGFLGGCSFSSNINCGHAVAANINGSFYSDIYSGDPYGNHRSSIVVTVPKDINWHFIVSGYNTSTNLHFMYLDGIKYTRNPNF
ncbi:MAG: type II secretion system protein [Tissierellia bacterium]|nr:type II secretion system protein [Tissierellia bacterium]